ncbi:toll/interleukin-1 receptor domain-containing protein [Accumulibacter sp.]|uniref:toll/interleukin-1 receptor domain-containing protein n=1 Tax=Accumulibacter sp. TaxID=2053492 RepID=UPI002626135C|nr:toll/interleukin-1 receptor domain-containing protein [Accumulibacter sp.]
MNATADPSASFDVFLSHNSRDKPAVRLLAVALRRYDLKVWLDEEQLCPGQNWQPLIADAVRRCRSFVALVGEDGLGPWGKEEVELALSLRVGDCRPLIPVLLPEAPRKDPAIPDFMNLRTWVDLRPGLNEDNLDRLVWGITGRKPLRPVAPEQSPAENPFDPWTPVIPPRFFGRERLLRKLQDALDRGGSVSLVGDARIGKSSIVQTWAQGALEAGRMVRVISGEGAEAESCSALIQAVSGATVTGLAADEAANLLSDWVDAAPGGLAPLLLIDEAERLLAHLPHRFFERLRGMLGRICLVFATRHEIGEIAREDQLTSPLLNRVEVQRVGLLEPAGVAPLIALGNSVLTPADSATMREWAGRHPFYLNLLGHYLWDARRNRDSASDALDEFQENAFQRLRECWQALPERERRLLAKISREAKPEADAALKRRGLLDEGQVFGRVLKEWLVRQA